MLHLVKVKIYFMNSAEQKFDLWCIVELFGHTKIAGKCTEQNIAGTNMLRVDVPETTTQPKFTRFFGSSAIYSIIPVDEDTCKFMAEKIQVKPIESWNISEIVKKNHALLLEGSVKQVPAGDQDDNDEDDGSDRDY